ncbi:MAG: hypothetical protein M3P83_12530 [Actinomycetota bacterium]|nr:hypothetical protein [Actinomycetota bacterium]
MIGIAIDDYAREFVVVADPTLVDQARLQEDLRDVVGPALPVRVQAGCFGADALLEAVEVINARSWHTDAIKSSYAFELDPHDSRWHVNFGITARDVGQSLQDRLGQIVSVGYAGEGAVRQTLEFHQS